MKQIALCFIDCSPLYGPCSQTSRQVRQTLCSWEVCVHAQEEVLDCEPSLPRFLCFSEPKYFPSGGRETRMIDGLEPSLISSLADSLVMYAPGWCADSWQLIDSPGLGYREDETCLEHLTRCLCGAPEHCRLNPLWMQARYARLGRWLSAPSSKLRFFPSMTDREQNSLHFCYENEI